MRGRGEGDTNEYYARRRTTFPAWNGDDGYVEGEVAPFGYSLTLDLYHCDPAVIANISCVYEYLEGLVDALKMHTQAPPFVFRSPIGYADKQGISAWVPLIESGISVHTLEPRSFATVDIFCCHKFDVDVVLAVTKLHFSPQDIDMHEIKRGVRYYQD